jgi:hypothetical protein
MQAGRAAVHCNLRRNVLGLRPFMGKRRGARSTRDEANGSRSSWRRVSTARTNAVGSTGAFRGRFAATRLADALVDEASLRGKRRRPVQRRNVHVRKTAGSGPRIGTDRRRRTASGDPRRARTTEATPAERREPAGEPRTRARVATSQLMLRDRSRAPAKPSSTRARSSSKTTDQRRRGPNRIVPPPAAGSLSRPAHRRDACIDVFNTSGTGEVVTVDLPQSGCAPFGDASDSHGQSDRLARPDR